MSRQTKLPFAIMDSEKDLLREIPKFQLHRDEKIKRLQQEKKDINKKINKLQKKLDIENDKNERIQTHLNLLSIVKKLEEEREKKGCVGYLVEGTLLDLALEHKERLETLGFHIESKKLAYQWEMVQDGNSDWEQLWDEDIFLHDDRGIVHCFYKEKEIIEHADDPKLLQICIYSTYLNLNISKEEEDHFIDIEGTGTRTFCLFEKTEIGLIMESSKWKLVVKALQKEHRKKQKLV